MPRVTLRDGRTINASRGHACNLKRDCDIRMQELDGFKVGDHVRLIGEHYEVGIYAEGVIRGLWDNGPYPDVASPEACAGRPKDEWPVRSGAAAIVRFHAANLLRLDYAGDGIPAFEDGGYELAYLEKIA